MSCHRINNNNNKMIAQMTYVILTINPSVIISLATVRQRESWLLQYFVGSVLCSYWTAPSLRHTKVIIN